jgi:hypothetical protein
MDDFEQPKNNIVRIDFEKNSQNLETKLLSQQKREIFEEWLSKGLVTVLLDARLKEVEVPPDFKSEGALRLNFSYAYNIIDFNFDDKAVRASLTFEKGIYLCYIPWPSVYGLQSPALDQGAVWFMDFPVDQDQSSVLGFSESEDDFIEQESAQDNIIKYDFTASKDVVK